MRERYQTNVWFATLRLASDDVAPVQLEARRLESGRRPLLVARLRSRNELRVEARDALEDVVDRFIVRRGRVGSRDP